ncbi:MAG: uroporphyrinogen-III synthase [Pirellulales bacterium]|nr:uroporphyrinogen-III synthase [Pirellulales bacterium]
MSDRENFVQLRVAAFESRRAEEMRHLIERHGGQAFVSPSMREIPFGQNPAAKTFGRKIIAGEVDVVIFLTGVGLRHLIDEVSTHFDRGKFLAQLGEKTIVVRGPKPAIALRELGLAADFRAAEPNTWRELLHVIDEKVPLAGKTVAVQEHGQPNPSLTDALRSRGADVTNVTVYRWDLPEDLAPLQDNVVAIAQGNRDIAIFTSAHQVVNMLKVVQQQELDETFRAGFSRLAVASIGPTTSEMLRAQKLHVDFEPDHPRMGNLVAGAARRSSDILQCKQNIGFKRS